MKKPDWKQQEDDMVAAIGGRGTKASGAGWYDKGDGKHPVSGSFPLLWECKCTSSSSFTVSASVWFGLEKHAISRIPVLFVRFQGRKDIAVVSVSFASTLGVSPQSLGHLQTVYDDSILPLSLVVPTPLGLGKSLVAIPFDVFLRSYEKLASNG